MAAVVRVQLGQLGAIVTKADKAVFIHLLLSSVCQKTFTFSTPFPPLWSNVREFFLGVQKSGGEDLKAEFCSRF